MVQLPPPPVPPSFASSIIGDSSAMIEILTFGSICAQGFRFSLQSSSSWEIPNPGVKPTRKVPKNIDSSTSKRIAVLRIECQPLIRCHYQLKGGVISTQEFYEKISTISCVLRSLVDCLNEKLSTEKVSQNCVNEALYTCIFFLTLIL
uniref:Uncharacterized protein n=1 Tax=Ditylenchus dipsaci TaxID=166011 RepID=A0A915DFB4_9BILA